MTTYRYRIGHNARRDSEDTLELDEPIRNEDELQHVLDVHLSEVCDVWCYRVDEDGEEIPLDQDLPPAPEAKANATHPIDRIANAIRLRDIALDGGAGSQAESIHDYLVANGWTPPA